MIASISGTVLDLRLDSLVVSVNGLGYQVMASPDLISQARLGENVTLFTSLVVREDSLTLFGFSSADSREMFELIQSVSGFGPRLAFTILSFMSADELRSAIASGNTSALTRTPGVGTKGASRLILELKDRVGGSTLATKSGWEDQVEQALAGLGWSTRDAARAVTAIREQGSDLELSVPELLKLALQFLGRTK
ncbi:MAG: Holliday junction branch migration protein RuvA [Actinobacteria bacterium]|nr:Holliday junction branch migration protein RuvA [Actinomycetota bacterium]